MKHMIRILPVVALAAIVTAGVFVTIRFQSDIAAARQRAESGGQIIQTRCGPIEYAEAGQGRPVLVIHGAGGGYDQGLLLAQVLIGDGYRVIAPSRFGYLRAQHPADHTPAAQAEAHACLLDALGVEQTVIVGVSAGGPSALQFAQTYPERTSALILVSAVGPKPQPDRETSDDILKTILDSDFLYWAMVSGGRQQMVAMLGVSPQVQARLTPEEVQWEDKMLGAMLPITLRGDGILDDFHIDRAGFQLERIAAPTLVFHAVDDTLVFYEDNGKYNADHIPGARLVTLPDGGHFLMGQHARVRQETASFLKTRLAAADGWD